MTDQIRPLLEDDFIISSLGCLAIDLQRSGAVSKEAAIDKSACILTAYMQGQIKEVGKKAVVKALHEIDEAIVKSSIPFPETREALRIVRNKINEVMGGTLGPQAPP